MVCAEFHFLLVWQGLKEEFTSRAEYLVNPQFQDTWKQGTPLPEMETKVQQHSQEGEEMEHGYIPIALDISGEQTIRTAAENLPSPDELGEVQAPRHTEFENLIHQSRELDFADLIKHVDELVQDIRSPGFGNSTLRATTSDETINNPLSEPLFIPPVSKEQKRKVGLVAKKEIVDEGVESDDTIKAVKQNAVSPALLRTRVRSGTHYKAKPYGLGLTRDEDISGIQGEGETIGLVPIHEGIDTDNQDGGGDARSLFARLTLGNPIPKFDFPTEKIKPTRRARQRQGGGYYGMAVGYQDKEGQNLGGIYPTKGNEWMFEDSSDGEDEEDKKDSTRIGLGIIGAGLEQSWVKDGGCSHSDCSSKGPEPIVKEARKLRKKLVKR
ncbi:hypothetical protein HYALB_00006324 [Hymenoscyphus albidus]|uniref:Uncharacterized protein n=1 Tax=Hymenoscyphus albidus TaxID=595503 RepID=A0A9N9LK22_9HELO|nr:hypothetical protein HYALB_00006324 [Hymenoscyphus albidus]